MEGTGEGLGGARRTRDTAKGEAGSRLLAAAE